MPTENEDDFVIPELLPETMVDNSLDVTEFNTPSIPEDHHQIVVTLDTGEDLTLIVHERYCDLSNRDSEVTLSIDLDEDEMEEFINLHSICWLAGDGDWLSVSHIRDVRYSHYSNEWLRHEESVFGYYNRGEEGYFSYNESYVRCADTDSIYIDSDEADYHNCYYCDNCDEYRDSDEHDFDECGHSGCDDHFHNHQSKIRHGNDRYILAHNKKYGVDSPTFSISNGMMYTFGVEIETHRGYLDYWDDLNLSSVYDGSISGNEYVTGVLKGDYGFNHLKKICNRINESGHEINSKCGVHVHIGGEFNRRFTIMLLRLCYHLQDDIYRMMPPSRVANTYCKPIPTWASEINFQNFREILGRYIYGGNEEDNLLDKHHNKKVGMNRYESTRYKWVNINNFSTASGKPTVEFRIHGASTNYEKLRNWTLICMSIVRYAENRQKTIWCDLKNISLEKILVDSLGANLGLQVSNYYHKRVSVFKDTSGKSSSLPSAILEGNGVIV